MNCALVSPNRAVVKLTSEQVRPTGCGHPHFKGNWPMMSTVAVTYLYNDRASPSLIHPRCSRFFSDDAQFNSWLSEAVAFITSSEGAFSISYDVYRWDLGPVYFSSGYQS